MSSTANGSNRPPVMPEPGAVLHQRRSMPFCHAKMAVGGFLVVGTIAYFTLQIKAKPGVGPSELAKVVANKPN